MASYQDEHGLDELGPTAVAAPPQDAIDAAIAASGLLRDPLSRHADEDGTGEAPVGDFVAAARLFAGIRNHLLRSAAANGDADRVQPTRSNHVRILESIVARLVEHVSEVEAQPRPDPVSQRFLDTQLATVDVGADSPLSASADDQCVICCEDFSRFSVAKRTPCGHVFHAACVIRWLEEKHVCPVCRADFPSRADELAAGKSRNGSVDELVARPQSASNLAGESACSDSASDDSASDVDSDDDTEQSIQDHAV